MGYMINAYNVFLGKYEGKRSFERPTRRSKDNIRMGLREIGWEDVDWMHLAKNRVQ